MYLVLKPCLYCLRSVSLLLLCKGWRELALLAVHSWTSLLHSRGLHAGCDRHWQLPDNGRCACSLSWCCCKLPSSSQESLLHSKELSVLHLHFEPVRLAYLTRTATVARTAMFLSHCCRCTGRTCSTCMLSEDLAHTKVNASPCFG